MSEYNISENLHNDEDGEINNKISLDKEKIVDRILISVLIVFCIVLTILGVDIEKKLKIINEKEPILISAETTELMTDISMPATNTSQEETTTETVSVVETTASDNTTSKQEQSTILTSTTHATTQEVFATMIDTTTPTTAEASTSVSQTTSVTTTRQSTTKFTTTPPLTTQAATTQKQTTEPTQTPTSKLQSDGKYYITASGTKYHISTCSYLSKTKIEIDLDEAIKKGYSPCSRCIK